MRRRRFLALGTAAVSVAGYEWYRGDGRDEAAGVAPSATDPAEELVGGSGESASTGDGRGPLPESLRLGGTLNGRPRRLRENLSLIEKSNTTWLHSFLDVRKKLASDVPARKDPDVVALRRAANEQGAKLVVSLRWDFKGIWDGKPERHVPEADSSRETALFEYATKLLRALDHQAEIVVLGNEPVWETFDEDLTGDDASLVSFTRRLKDHLVETYAGNGTRILVGAVNRLFDDEDWADYYDFYQALFDLVQNEDGIDGLDTHIHYSDISDATQMLSRARGAVPDGIVTATEFSPMWRYLDHVDERIDTYEGGAEFLDRHGLPADMRSMEFFETAKDSPRPPKQMGEFMSVMPWYNENLMRDMHEVLSRYDVAVGTIGFLLGPGVRNVTWDENWRPFQIGFLFQRPLIASEDGAHPHFFDDYRELA